MSRPFFQFFVRRVKTEAIGLGLQVAPLRPDGLSAPTRIVKELSSQRVSPDCVVQIMFAGPVTQQAGEKLIAHLQLAKDNYPNGME
jgi:hypothetical protein